MLVTHATFTLERPMPAAPEAVFDAYTNPRLLETWAVAEGTTFHVLDSEVRTGGSATAELRADGALVATVAFQYHNVIDDQLLCFTEVFSQPEGVGFACLSTILFEEQTNGCLLRFTSQLSGFGPEEMAQEVRDGVSSALDNLQRLVSKRS